MEVKVINYISHTILNYKYKFIKLKNIVKMTQKMLVLFPKYQNPWLIYSI